MSSARTQNIPVVLESVYIHIYGPHKTVIEVSYDACMHHQP